MTIILGPRSVKRLHAPPTRLVNCRVDEATIYSDITGRPVSKVRRVTHDEGEDVTIQPATITVEPDELEGLAGMHLNEVRARMYHQARELFGLSDEEARARLFPTGKVKA